MMATSSSVPVDKSSSHASLIAELADDFADRMGRGETPDIEEYVQRAPRAKSVVRDVLKSLELMHQMGSRDPSERRTEKSQDIPLVVGDYQIIDEIGRGGMGVVYRARQISLGRIVALKVLPFAASLDPIKLKRFQVETQSASMIQHPNIVAIYGPGSHQGVHYYAMQFIDGQPLDEYLTAVAALSYTDPTQGLASRPTHEPARVITHSTDPIVYEETEPGSAHRHPSPCTTIEGRAIRPIVSPMNFRQMAELGFHCASALHEAHELGVIHRDIKPSNLIIDCRGKVWITDFGLAHMDSEGSLTLTGDILGTVRYMSPEQASGGTLPVDRRTDVYSLGATLFELLAGEPMLPGKDRAALLRQLAMGEPRNLRRLNRAVPRDLETIVQKAVAREPHNRYASAIALADDLQRFLKDEPIQARRQSVFQRLTKLAKRHRTAAWTVATVPILAFLGLVVTNIEIARQRNRAEEALAIAQIREKEATSEAAKARTVSQVLQQMVGAANPDRSKGSGYTVRQLLDDLSSQVFEPLADQPEVEVSLRSTIGNAYRRLGAPDKARPHLARALQLKQISPDSQPLQVAESLEDLAWNEAALRRYDKAEELARQAVAIHRQAGHPTLTHVRALWCLQHCLIYRDQFETADTVAQEAMELAKRLDPVPPEVANILHDLSHSKNLQKKFEEAESLARQSVQMHATLHGPTHPETGWGLDALARSLQSQGKHDQAAEVFRQALDVFQKNYPPDHKSVRMTMELLQSALIKSGDLEQAEKIDQARFSEAIRATVLSPSSQSTGLLQLLIERKQFLAAGQLILSAPDLFQETESCLQAVEWLGIYSQRIAERFADDRDPEAQQQWRDTAIQLLRRAAERCPDDPTMMNSVAWNAVSLPDPSLHQPQQAMQIAKRALERKPDAGAIWNTLGLAQYRAGHYEDAIASFEKSRSYPTTDEYDLTFLAMAHWQVGRKEIALPFLREALAKYENRSVPNPELERFLKEAATLVGQSAPIFSRKSK
jgi:serine/threonine protein kinase/Flp pilus assembly protein TadD